MTPSLFEPTEYRPLARKLSQPGPRWCYRCADCLTVSFTLEPLTGRGDYVDGRYIVRVADCGQCGGPIESMGRVAGARCVTTDVRCACDARCTGATGPNCDCSCRGANHGTGRTVEIVRDLGPVPRLVGLTDFEAQERAKEYRKAVADVAARIEALKGGTGRKWLSDSDYSRYVRLTNALATARKNRTHAARMRHLLKALAS